MPVTLTYPGVYVTEVPSGVRTITGVPTSIAAFVGRALRGPLNDPVTINGFADFETKFGGLWLGSALGYAVRDFFLNGGGQAIVVRVFKDYDPAKASHTAHLTLGDLKFVAASPGTWGADLRLATTDGKEFDDALAASIGADLTKADLFSLVVRDTSTGRQETYTALTVKESPRRVDRVLKSSSMLVRYDGVPGGEKDFLGKMDAQSTAEQALADAQKASPVDPAKVTAAGAALKAARNAVLGKTAAVPTPTPAPDPAPDPADTPTDPPAAPPAPLTASDGDELDGTSVLGSQAAKTGIYALEKADLFNLLCIPPYKGFVGAGAGTGGDVDLDTLSKALAYCTARRAMLIVDPPSGWTGKEDAKSLKDFPVERSKDSVLYFPRLSQPNPLRGGAIESFAPCGAVAGVIARTDTNRGVWKAPAGTEATFVGVPDLSVPLTDPEVGELNPHGFNSLRVRPEGRVVWGARTLRGDDLFADEYKYLPVRRTALFIEESLFRGLQWVVFEPNDEPLWAQIRLNAGAFMHNLFRQGAFQGASARDAYFVKCDKETTTQNDVDQGIVNVVVGFAPLKPAEFVVLKLQQIAGPIEV